MVIYDLECDLGHAFEGWFANSDDFATQQRDALICCPVCESAFVEKKLSAPHVSTRTGDKSSGRNRGSLDVPQDVDQTIRQTEISSAEKAATPAEAKQQFIEYQKALKTVHDYVEKNFDDVGTKFTEQAIAMHTGEIPEKAIRGTASQKQRKELRERGVGALNLPRKPIDKDKLN